MKDCINNILYNHNHENWVNSLQNNIKNIIEVCSEYNFREYKKYRILLCDKFDITYDEADILQRTISCYIATVEALKRYQNSGIQMIEIFAPHDERRCPECMKLHEKQFNISEIVIGQNAPPFHQGCRCTILPVID